MVKLFVSTFGQKVPWKNCIPIEVGASRRETFLYDIKDNVGDNISEYNAYFGELTGLYWIWKNYPLDENDIIGFCHYNKCLEITELDIKGFFEKSPDGWIVRDGISTCPHICLNEVYCLENILKENTSDIYEEWVTLYYHDGSSNGNICHGCEMFYCSKCEFDNYCEFLFGLERNGLLFKLFEQIGEVDRIPYHMRYIAHLGERLLSVYLKYYHNPVKEVDMVPVNGKWLRKVAHLLKLNPNTRCYQFMAKYFGNQSSYLSSK